LCGFEEFVSAHSLFKSATKYTSFNYFNTFYV
jgi:hypothetical protein